MDFVIGTISAVFLLFVISGVKRLCKFLLERMGDPQS